MSGKLIKNRVRIIMLKSEKLLGIASESNMLGNYNDALSLVIDSVHSSGGVALSDDDLLQVAGGVGANPLLIQKLKKNLNLKG